jgi:hypothetical protein
LGIFDEKVGSKQAQVVVVVVVVVVVPVLALLLVLMQLLAGVQIVLIYILSLVFL